MYRYWCCKFQSNNYLNVNFALFRVPTHASGTRSTSIGTFTEASGNYSTSMRLYTDALS